MVNYPDDILYSSKYEDDVYEYRHVTLPKAWIDFDSSFEILRFFLLDLFQISKKAQAIIQSKPTGLLSEQEWRMLGVQQSRGWQHYLVHKRPLGTNPQTGMISI
ncbi:putative Cyclin dependent kinase regulatory subunit [Cryptosporidium parvum]